MGKTLVEKILAAHTDEEVVSGGIVWIDIDVRTARDFGGANVVKNLEREFGSGVGSIADTSKTHFTFDCVAPANNIPYANNQHICRLFAREHGTGMYDVDSGIGSHVVIEEGLAIPGSTVVGTDSHLNIMGSIGAFGQGMGDMDIAFVWATGKTWFEVPGSIKLLLKGNYAFPCQAKDLTLKVVGELGASGALGSSVEVYGASADGMKLHERITLASMGTEMGAIIVLIPPDDALSEELAGMTGVAVGGGFVGADADAVYSRTIKIDIDGLVPLVSLPGAPHDVVPAADCKDTKVDSIFIGSCTNGRYEDIASVAEIVKGRKVSKGVMVKVTPATRSVYRRCLRDGIFETLFDAGFIVSHSGCGGCASGQLGMTGKGEVQVSTSNRNFKGKQGDGKTFLASPATAAASALLGRIGTADEVL